MDSERQCVWRVSFTPSPCDVTPFWKVVNTQMWAALVFLWSLGMGKLLRSPTLISSSTFLHWKEHKGESWEMPDKSPHRHTHTKEHTYTQLTFSFKSANPATFPSEQYQQIYIFCWLGNFPYFLTSLAGRFCLRTGHAIAGVIRDWLRYVTCIILLQS